ncbi:hypothetical protein VTK26DRAFT_5509 [Humicola hyalothermophila]
MTKQIQPKLKLYWLNNSRAQRIVWLLEELGLPYEVEIFHRNKDMFAPSELRKVHPLGKSPMVKVTIPQTSQPATQKELVLAESGLIAQYLADHFGPALLPKRYRDGQEGQPGGETEEWMRCQYFLHYAEGSLHPPLLVQLILMILKGPKIPFVIRPITSFVVDKMFENFVAPQMALHLGFVESQLATAPGKGGYLCGDRLTVADILMSYPLLEARDRAYQLETGKTTERKKWSERYPKLWDYLKRLEEEPGFKRAEVKITELEAGRK